MIWWWYDMIWRRHFGLWWAFFTIVWHFIDLKNESINCEYNQQIKRILGWIVSCSPSCVTACSSVTEKAKTYLRILSFLSAVSSVLAYGNVNNHLDVYRRMWLKMRSEPQRKIRNNFSLTEVQWWWFPGLYTVHSVTTHYLSSLSARLNELNWA